MRRKIGIGLLYSALACSLIAMFGVLHAAAVNYTNQYYLHLFNSLIDNTAIGATTPAQGFFSNVRAAANTDTTQTSQGMYNQWNLGGIGDSDFVDVRGLGSGAFNWYIGTGTNPGVNTTLIMQLTASTLSVPGITLAHAPTLCASGSASGIDVNGNATGCSNKGSVMAAVKFTTCTIGTDGSTDQGCQPASPVSWGVTLPDTNYIAQCTLVMPDSYTWPDSGAGDALAQSTITTQSLTTTGFKYSLLNVHTAADGNTMTAACTATHL